MTDQLAKVIISSTVQTVLTVTVRDGETDSEIEARIAGDFGADPEDVFVSGRALASGVIKALSLNPGDSFVDG